MIRSKRIISLILCLSFIIGIFPLQAAATESPESIRTESAQSIVKPDQKLEETNTLGEIGGYLAGNALNTAHLYADRKFTSQQWGFGFAAENGNNLADRFKGLDAFVVGDNNAANGPDRRIVNRFGNDIWIQTKYHSTARESVRAAFDDAGNYRYLMDGKPMQLEVPADQYDEAVKLMKKKISKGMLKSCGVTDPDDAVKIVRKGSLTYNQAKNIAKAGNIDSLKYDSKNGVISASCAAGIAFVIDYVCCRLNDLTPENALKTAGLNGVKTGGVVFATYLISSQLAKTGLADSLANALIPTAKAITKTFGDDVCKVIIQKAAGQTAGKATEKQIADTLARGIIADGVLVVVLTSLDVVELFRGRISKEELLKNLCVSIVSIAMGTAGGYGGALLGNMVVPGLGGTIGMILGSAAAGGLTTLAVEASIAPHYESDAEEMFTIISDEFTMLCSDYLVNENEANHIVDALKDKLVGDILKDMFQSEDRKKFARELIEPLFEDEVLKRNAIVVPSEEEIRYGMKEELNGIVFIQ